MNAAIPALLIALLSLSAGCANTERSRELGNPAVPATTLAQQVCSNCHGVTGNAISPNFPNLAGQLDAYTVAQLNVFKSHDRKDPAGFEYMWGISRGLTEDQIKGLAAYYAAQTPAPQPIEGYASRIEPGRAVYDNGVPAAGVPACASCHGPQGQGAGEYPRLSGQHADYVIKQLLVFQRTVERPEGAVMKVVAHGLNRQDIEDVATYVQAMGNR